MTDGAVVVRHVPLVRPVHPVADVRAFAAVRHLLVSNRPRVLHTHMAKAGSVGRLAALSVARAHRPHLVHTFHGHVLAGYFASRVERAFIEAERRLARRTDVLVAVSPEIRDELIDLGIGTTRQYRVVSFGVALEPFARIPVRETGAPGAPGAIGPLRQHLGVGSATPLVGVVGRLVPIKALDLLITAMASLPDAHLVVVGDGDERAALEATARRLGLTERVHFTGWWKDIPGVMSDLDVVALSSRNEGTPVALIEALASARPVVATDVGGVRHVVHDGEDGLLVPPGDADALASALRTLLADEGLRRRFGEVGRERVVREFGSERFLAQMAEVYDELNGPARVRTR
jgi:glycosyltransferase involved in cell wall biosynthesis